MSLSSDPWARVFIDGRDTGRSTPIVKMTVPAGRHHVELRQPSGAVTAFVVTVIRGREVRLSKTLRR